MRSLVGIAEIDRHVRLFEHKIGGPESSRASRHSGKRVSAVFVAIAARNDRNAIVTSKTTASVLSPLPKAHFV